MNVTMPVKLMEKTRTPRVEKTAVCDVLLAATLFQTMPSAERRARLAPHALPLRQPPPPLLTEEAEEEQDEQADGGVVANAQRLAPVTLHDRRKLAREGGRVVRRLCQRLNRLGASCGYQRGSGVGGVPLCEITAQEDVGESRLRRGRGGSGCLADRGRLHDSHRSRRWLGALRGALDGRSS